MDALTVLKKDHDKVSKLLKQGEKTTARAAKSRTKIFEQVKTELANHTELEETLFYPSLKEYKATRDLIFEAYEEHDLIEHMLDLVEDTDPEDEEWKARFTLLKEVIEHHVKEEEKSLFPKVKKLLSKQELNEIGNEMLLFKEEQL